MAYVKSNVQSAFKMCEGFEGGAKIDLLIMQPQKSNLMKTCV